MSRRAWRNPNGSDRTNSLKDRRALDETMLPHRNVVRMIIEMDAWDGHAKSVLLARMQRHAVAFLGHIFADEPYASSILVRFDRANEVRAPITDVGAPTETGSER